MQHDSTRGIGGAMDLVFEPQVFYPVLHFLFQKPPADGEASVVEGEASMQANNPK